MQPIEPMALADELPRWREGRLQVRCVRIDQETHDVATFVFRADEPMLFPFKPGQFVTVEPLIEGQRIARCYSVSSTPSRPYTFSITVKRVPDGLVSNWLHDHLREGDALSVQPPRGDFNLVDRPARRILMLSGGSGITPVMSMARWLHDTAADADVHFVHAARSPADIIYRDELEAMFGANRRFRLSITCEGCGEGGWSGYRGRLDARMLQQMVPDLMQRTVFTCGPEPYMEAVRGILRELGFPAERYHEESFGGGSTTPPAEQADPIVAEADDDADTPTGDAAVEAPARTGQPVRLARSGKAFTCEPSETLLQAARRNGAFVQCACQMGVCGTCKVMLNEGAVQMHHMGGIDPGEEAAGYVLACCSYPVGPVTLDL